MSVNNLEGKVYLKYYRFAIHGLSGEEQLDMKWGCYELLRPAEIEAIRGVSPVAYVPWGALEWHSYHNPIGLDGLKARGLCEALAQQTGGVVLPPFYVGTDTIKPFKGFDHTLEHRESTVMALCEELLTQLVDEDFRIIVLVTGHYGREHVRVLKETAAAVLPRLGDSKVWVVADWEPVLGQFEDNHAARGETSYQMLFHPDTVDLTQLPDDRVTTLDDDGIAGEDPRLSTADFGQAQLDAFVSASVPVIFDLLNEVGNPGA
jgi:creatinine amidohydrolase